MKTRRMAGVGVAAAAVMTLAACGGGSGEAGGDSASQGGGQGDGQQMTQQSSTSAPSSASKSGVTMASDVYGPACGKVPKSGPGSVGGMIDDPVATAASNNPLLDKLAAAVKAAKLGDTLNSAEGITVFAPYDGAFKALPEGKFQQLASMPDKLGSILKYHVVPKRYDATGLAEAGQVKTLAGKPVKITGQGTDIKIGGAKVLCGNIPTANATVFVIDSILMPGSGSGSGSASSTKSSS